MTVAKRRKHPYEAFEELSVWQVIDAEVSSLVANRDLEETTARRYIVGSLCKALHDAAMLSAAAKRPRKPDP